MNLEPLDPYLPEATRPIVESWLRGRRVQLCLKRPRRSKLGDFRAPLLGQLPTISVNIDLAPHQFLLTLTHEIAHFLTWSDHGPRVRAHGSEWKRCFARLLRELSDSIHLLQSVRDAFIRHAQKPKSASHYDPYLAKAISQADGQNALYLDDLDIDQIFTFRGRLFKKLAVNRTRCRCLDMTNGLEYRIGRMAPVTIASPESPPLRRRRETWVGGAR